MASGPVVVGYDGSPASERALQAASTVLAARRALVVVVWEPERIYEPLDPMYSLAAVDVRVAVELDKAMYEHSRRLAEQGATRLREAGFEAEGLAVHDVITVGMTLVRLAEERDAPAVVVGSHGHRALREIVMGSTTQEVVRRAPCPALVVRGPKDEKKKDDKG